MIDLYHCCVYPCNSSEIDFGFIEVSIKVKMEEVKVTRLVLIVNILGVFGRESDEVLSSTSQRFIPSTNIIIMGKGGDVATKHGAPPLCWESEGGEEAEVLLIVVSLHIFSTWPFQVRSEKQLQWGEEERRHRAFYFSGSDLVSFTKHPLAFK